MKVLLIAENPPGIYGGIERHCFNLMQLFAGSDLSMSMLSKRNVPFYTIKWINKIVFDEYKLAELISNSKCDIVHVHGFASVAVCQALKIALKLKVRVVYTAHYHPFQRLDNPNFGRLFFYIFLRPLLKNIDHIITINKEDTAFFKQYNSKVTMIPNWLSSVADKENEEVKDKKEIILFVGRNDSNKSPDYLWEIPRGRYEIHCVTDVDKNMRDDFIIHTHISDEELRRLYKQASLLVAPSRYEAFSYVVLEALTVGTPALISDRVRIMDHLQGVSGVTVFTYGNKKEFEHLIPFAMRQVVNTEQLRQVFDPVNIREKLLSVYHNLI